MSSEYNSAAADYVLVTAAYNEEMYIEKTLRSVVSQTRRPMMWVVVSDASTDRTDDIVLDYAAKYPFIALKRITEPHPRNFAAQVLAINTGCKQLQGCAFAFIGNLDADVSFAPTYYEELLRRFAMDDRLGLAGGFIFEQHSGRFRPRPWNNPSSVAHAVQLFRKPCFEEVGGYVPLKYGGPDWFAEVRARQFGWKVASFPDLPVYHHRPTAGAERLVQARLRQGRMDYSVGSLLPFEILKCARRLSEPPWMIGAAVRFYGFASSYVRRAPRLVPDDFARYLRSEQRRRLMSLLRSSFHRYAPNCNAD